MFKNNLVNYVFLDCLIEMTLNCRIINLTIKQTQQNLRSGPRHALYQLESKIKIMVFLWTVWFGKIVWAGWFWDVSADLVIVMLVINRLAEKLILVT